MMKMENCPPFRSLAGRKPEEYLQGVKTPCYILDEAALRRNGEIIKGVIDRTGAKILLAQKAFSNYDLYPLLTHYLSGTEASGLFEARLGAERFVNEEGEKCGEVHVFCGAYREDEFEELLQYADHIVFNFPSQLKRFGAKAKAAGKSIGIRVNPECSTQEGHEIYDPCAPGSRLGTTRAQWDANMTADLAELLDGIHFHTLCEQNSDDLWTTLQAVNEKFGDILPRLKWVNMGGGHHITRDDYDIELLEKCIRYAQETWQVEVYLEPGEAVALNAGYLATRVLDVLQNGDANLIIMDTSPACHTPDVLEMPYLPPLYEAEALEDWRETPFGEEITSAGDKSYRYRLGGPTCLAGDVAGDYLFAEKKQVGDLLFFGDMAIYSTCKNNTFNGMPLPGIYLMKEDGRILPLKLFDYHDFEMRLGS